jgi:hypothetical protein
LPSPASIAAAALLSLAAGSTVFSAWRAVASFDATKLGNDTASLHRQKFAALRADLPPGSLVCMRGHGAAIPPDLLPIADLMASRLHEQLTTGRSEPVPGFDRDHLRQLAEGFRNRYSPEDNRDPAAVRKNLESWWAGLADGFHLHATRYALAPHLVVTTAPTPWIVGDFPAGYDYAPLAARERWHVVKDYGGGAVLFRAEP